MGGKSGSAPRAPDPAATAAAQTAANKEAVRESALVNQIGQVTPFGNVSFSGEIGTPERTQTLTLPPEVQAALEGQQRIAGGLTGFAEQFVPRVAESLGTPFSTESLGPAPTADRQRIEDALLGRLEPLIARDEDRLRNRLANQGIAQGSEAFGSALDDFGRGRTDARLATIGQAGQEFSRDFGLQQQARQQAISEALLNRTQGLNEVSALLQGAPALQQPSLPQPSQFQVQPADILGAQQLQFAGQQNAFNQNQAGNRSALGGLAGLGGALGGAAILASDRRLKTDIKRVGELDSGLPVYTFRYKSGGPVQMGVMAQDVEKTMPEAVHEMNGMKAVDYGAL